MADNQPSDMVLISAARLAELEAAAAKVAKQREKNKEQVHQCINKNREAYNARRRELYRLKKANGAAAAVVVPQSGGV
jgi:hypothetical protein